MSPTQHVRWWGLRFSRIVTLTILFGLARAVDAGPLPPPASQPVDYARDVRPILAKHCYQCHGPQRQKGGLSLHAKARALAGGDGGPAFEAGKSAESRLIELVAAVDEDDVMPPQGGGERLTPEQVGVLRAWIDQGAAWPDDPVGSSSIASDHWSFRRPVRSDLPEVKRSGWARNPIDRFVQTRLDREGMIPAPEADRTTLIRRLSLDLIGLPPTIDEVDLFVADTRLDAYERLVERLLQSPHYGERWGRRWLDRARYADTNGYEKDRERSIWPYRDWVIQAINADMPFDQFTVEQIAGDLLPNATRSQQVATGFHRNTMINEEGGIDVEEFRFTSLVDRVATTGAVWLGLTIQCAQCHTHKYDPITQREYYQFFSFFNNADEPEIDVPDPAITVQRQAIEAKIAGMEAGREAQFAEHSKTESLETRIADWEKTIKPVHWTPLRPTRLVSAKQATLTVLDDLSVLASGDKPNQDTYEIDVSTDLKGVTALRLEVLPDPSLPNGGPGRAPLFSVGDFLLTEFQVVATPAAGAGSAQPVPIQNASEDYSEPNRPAALAVDGIPDTGWTVKGGVGQAHAAVFEFRDKVGDGAGGKLTLTLRQEGIHQMTIGRFRISATSDRGPIRASKVPADVEELLLRPSTLRSELEQSRLKTYFLSIAPELADSNKQIAALRRSLPLQPTTLVMRERLPEHARTTHIHKRGEFLKITDPVAPGMPSVLPALQADEPRNRLGLARWLVTEENPLVGRVVMNQVWQAYFGRGLVATVDDFGTRGEKPTHPELLDWLATEFPRRGWSMKAMHRLIVTSSTYRQDSRISSEQLARDPKNEWLARGPRFRVEAEVVRDIALSASGLLNPAIGGPSVFPPQPDGVTALAYGSVAWKTSKGSDRFRRGLYTYTKRTAPYAAFTVMDAPTSETACVRRERSNTPLQALTLLNDTVFIEAARSLAQRVLDEAPDDDQGRARHAYRLCLSRLPHEQELATLIRFYQQQCERFRLGEADPARVAGLDEATARDVKNLPELAAWTTVARALLNLDETISKE
ncbi:Planctomycete cytochrome C [Singulisphaera sp. GP187]|uniref:PSD1 and planctomycete cytochrome C domain-containing protein n=1 Tax=Singulisphaera sp. GP187 TaxID=1882752 RepID=UPI00092B1E59|nr:PSD1 and planctomycete cytochrome C domain-containing protein [Singulisphaera sp. GP187]SIN90646.1 Planctomycete cytochrome C [Singulisphaera sp. GP187]